MYKRMKARKYKTNMKSKLKSAMSVTYKSWMKVHVLSHTWAGRAVNRVHPDHMWPAGRRLPISGSNRQESVNHLFYEEM